MIFNIIHTQTFIFFSKFVIFQRLHLLRWGLSLDISAINVFLASILPHILLFTHELVIRYCGPVLRFKPLISWRWKLLAIWRHCRCILFVFIYNNVKLRSTFSTEQLTWEWVLSCAGWTTIGEEAFLLLAAAQGAPTFMEVVEIVSWNYHFYLVLLKQLFNLTFFWLHNHNFKPGGRATLTVY